MTAAQPMAAAASTQARGLVAVTRAQAAVGRTLAAARVMLPLVAAQAVQGLAAVVRRLGVPLMAAQAVQVLAWSTRKSNTVRASSTTMRVALRLSPEIWYGYLNPANGQGQFQGFRYSNSIRGTVVPPAVSCPVPLEGTPPLGSCGSLPNGCQCSVDFDPGDGVHTYAMSCSDGSCACTRDGTIITTKPRINACNNDLTTQDQWRQSCLSTPGFCP